MAAPEATSDDDREEWDRLWSGRTQCQLRPPYNLGVRLDSRFGGLVSVTVSQVPVEVLDRLWFETQLCPVCGVLTVGAPRLAVQLNLVFESGLRLGQCAWVHTGCFESCPDTGMPSPIPW